MSTPVGQRANNFNLLRLLAALAVLYRHGYAFVDVHPSGRAARWLFELGDIAVDAFFVISGYLVTASLLVRRDLVQFCKARVLRIYPALLLSVLLTIVLFGLEFGSLPLSRYFSDRRTWSFAGLNGTLFGGIQLALPGVPTIPGALGAVNGSLWTLPSEVWMYT